MSNIQKLRDQPHLSASGIGDYLECGLLYRFSRIDKLTKDFVSASAELGTTVHKVLADYNTARKLDKPFDTDDFQERFELYWKETAEDKEQIKYSEGMNYKALLTQGHGLLNAFCDGVPVDGSRVIAVEEPFQFRIEGIEVPIIGVMDLIEEDESGTIIISDYKTSGKAYASDRVDKHLQMTIYQMAARANGYADREILLRIDCLIKTKTPKFEQYYTYRSEQDVHRMKRKILKVWEGIRKGVFIPNDTGWKCGYCQYKSHCEQWFNEGGNS